MHEHAVMAVRAVKTEAVVLRSIRYGEADRILPLYTPSRRAEADGALSARADALAFRLKLLLAAGLAPHLGACACCGEREQLAYFSGAAGGVVCGACEGEAFALDPDAHAFMAQALARPLPDAPHSSDRALGQLERAISDTLAHHAQVRLMPAVGRHGGA